MAAFHEVRVERVVFAATPPEEPRRVVGLRRTDANPDQELLITLAPGEAEMVEAALAGAESDPLPGVLAFAAVRLAAVEVVALGAGAFGARLSLESDVARHEIATSAGRGLSAALACACPVRVSSEVWEARAVDHADRAAERARAEDERRRLEKRLGGRRAPRTAGTASVAVTVGDGARTAIADALDAARSALAARHALLMHRAAGLVVGRGEGPAELLAAYAGAIAADDGELAELLRLELFPAEDEPSGIVFDELPGHWRVEIGPVTADRLPDAALRALHDRLNAVLRDG